MRNPVSSGRGAATLRPQGGRGPPGRGSVVGRFGRTLARSNGRDRALWGAELVGLPLLGLVLGAAGLGTFWVVILVVAGPVVAALSVLGAGRGGYVDGSAHDDPSLGHGRPSATDGPGTGNLTGGGS